MEEAGQHAESHRRNKSFQVSRLNVSGIAGGQGHAGHAMPGNALVDVNAYVLPGCALKRSSTAGNICGDYTEILYAVHLLLPIEVMDTLR